MAILGGARETPFELRVALLAKYGFGSYREMMELDLDEIGLLEHIAFTLNKAEELKQWQIQN